MAEWKQLISEWINEYASLQENEIKSFAAEHEHNHEIATAIFNLFYSEDESEPSNKLESESQYEQILENVCTQLFSFYRSKEVELQRFTLQFVPTLIYNYLSSVAQGNKKTCRCIETLLIGLYNFEVVDEEGKPKVVSFRLPSLAQASIYHEPLSLGSQFLTESALRRWEECNTKLVNWGPLPQVEVLNAQNRLKVMSALLFIYNRQLSLLPKLALRHFCIAASRIVSQGFYQKSSAPVRKISRIPVSPNFLLEMIEGAYFAMFNEFYTLAHQAVQDIDQRAQYELYPDVMLVSSAVINSLKNNPSGQPCDGPMGISVALSPATTTVTMSKSMITNASFRTKKLPDDIPIQAGQVVPTDSADMLTSITEECEAEAAPIQRGGAIRSSKPKLSSFPVLGKKTKDGKDKGATTSEKKVTLKESSKGIWNSLSGGGGDMVDAQQKSNVTENSVEANGSMKDEKMSLTSIQNSTENSDTRSQVTSDSLDMETTPRFAAMQVSSV
ncbi:hyccin [Helicoverpa armigera]|uniref:hyccin n=1 Tax=Helicoverpa armigera TaxID=29058 RepID=UPI000B3784CC